MQKLTGKELATLQAQAAGFSTSNHVRYLSEALEATRATGDPVEGLALLRALPEAGYAGRRGGEQKEIDALNDVGAWLEQRLLRDPRVLTERVVLELAWIRRHAGIAEAEAKAGRVGPRPAQQTRPGGPGMQPRHHPSAHKALRFGDRIDRIRQRREEAERSARAAVAVVRAPPSAAAAPAREPLPDRLPDVIEVEFVSFAEARKARQDARKREKREKLPKERFLPIQPVDPRLRPLATGLVCSTWLAGFWDVVDSIAAADGVPRPFFVRGIQVRDGKLVVHAVFTERLKAESTT
ncbi:hypothetical protein WMF31_34725 [Sorangium sp. So ce1036]|uniref:hypothetical protein n=1 Tax=Sorangium sp. So ce1036 TaxID=3133328 RepID=UPI003F041955